MYLKHIITLLHNVTSEVIWFFQLNQHQLKLCTYLIFFYLGGKYRGQLWTIKIVRSVIGFYRYIVFNKNYLYLFQIARNTFWKKKCFEISHIMRPGHLNYDNYEKNYTNIREKKTYIHRKNKMFILVRHLRL